jgi:hypothetical protein
VGSSPTARTTLRLKATRGAATSGRKRLPGLTPIRWYLGDATMTPIQTLAGLAVFAFSVCGALLTVRAVRPSAEQASATAVETSKHSCVDMNGKVFEWSSSNVPFAATCDAKPDAAK